MDLLGPGRNKIAWMVQKMVINSGGSKEGEFYLVIWSFFYCLYNQQNRFSMNYGFCISTSAVLELKINRICCQQGYPV